MTMIQMKSFQQIEATALHLDDSNFITLQLKSGNFMWFQVDTETQCNVIPLALYNKGYPPLHCNSSTITDYSIHTITTPTTAFGKKVPNGIQARSRQIGRKYQVRLKGDASPVQHAPSRRDLLALRD